MASQETYSLPTDYLKLEAAFIYESSGNQLKLTPIRVVQRDPSKSTGDPLFYYIWGINVSSVNSYYIGLNPIPDTNGTSNIEIYYRQQPLTMVSGGQAPEVLTPWQDYLVAYACYECYIRRGREWMPMAQLQLAEWKEGIEKARRYVNPLQLDWPTKPDDTGGYMRADTE